MASGINIKFKALGAGELKSSLEEIDKNMRLLGSELKATTSEFNKNDKSVEACTKRMGALGKNIDEQKKAVNLLADGVKKATDEFGENSDEVRKLQEQYNNAKTKLNNLTREYKENEAVVKGDTNAIQDSGSAMDDAGGKAVSFGTLLKANLTSDVIMAGIRALGQAIKDVGTDLLNTTVNAAAFADNILTLSAQTSVSTEKLQEMQYASELVDVDVETVTKSMAKNVKSMSNAADGSAKYADAYKQLGVSVTDANGQLRTGEDVYWDCIDALGQVSNETERDALAMQLFGKSAQDLNPLIEAGSGRMKELADKAHEAGYVMSGDTLNAFGAFDDQVQYLNVNSEAAKNAFGTLLLPALTELATTGNGLLGEFTNGLLGANGDIGKVGKVMGDALADVISEIVGYLPKITEAGTSMLLALSTGIIANLPAMVQAALDIVVALANGISQSLPELVPTIVSVILEIVTILTDPSNLNNLVQAAVAIVVALANGIIDSLPELLEQAPVIILQLLTALIAAAPEILMAGVEIITQVIGGIASMFGELWNNGGEIVGKIGEGISASWESLKQAGRDVINKLWEGIKEMWTGLKSWFTTVWDDLFGNRSIDINGYSGGGVGGGIGHSNAVGLDYVPYDNYGTYLHKGEMVVPADVATQLRRVVSLPSQSGVRNGISAQGMAAGGGGTVVHTGTIRVEGINSAGQMEAITDIIMDNLRMEARMA